MHFSVCRCVKFVLEGELATGTYNLAGCVILDLDIDLVVHPMMMPGEGGRRDPQKVFLDKYVKTEKSKIRETPRNQDSTCVLQWFSLCYQKVKVILWSIRTLWYKGWAGNNEKWLVRKKALSLETSSPDSKAAFSGKLELGIWGMILVRYDIILNI